MLKLNHTFFKSLSLTLFFAFCAMGCGSTPTPQDYFDSIDLSTDTVVIDVPLPLNETDQEIETKGGVAKTENSPVEFNKIKKIWMIAKDASGEKKLIATSTLQDTHALQDNHTPRGVPITQIDAIESSDRIWLTDAKNDAQYVASIDFFQSPTIVIAIDLMTYGSTSFLEIYQNGDSTARFYIHFERK